MKKTFDLIASILILIGALNWGLVGLFDFNLVAAIFGESVLARIIYILVGLSAVYEIAAFKGLRQRWACESPVTHHPSRV